MLRLILQRCETESGRFSESIFRANRHAGGTPAGQRISAGEIVLHQVGYLLIHRNCGESYGSTGIAPAGH